MRGLSLYLLRKLTENSVRAEATRVDIGLFIDEASDQLRLSVDDDGRGLATTPEQTLDPFYTTKPGKKTGVGPEPAEGGGPDGRWRPHHRAVPPPSEACG